VPGVPEIGNVLEGGSHDASLQLLLYLTQLVLRLMLGFLSFVYLIEVWNIGIVLACQQLGFEVAEEFLVSDALACLHLSRLAHVLLFVSTYQPVEPVCPDAQLLGIQIIHCPLLLLSKGQGRPVHLNKVTLKRRGVICELDILAAIYLDIRLVEQRNPVLRRKRRVFLEDRPFLLTSDIPEGKILLAECFRGYWQ
jgi:hypothetical protein